ncbi:TetR/AcrR family transcriptional regulator [Deinococcus hopiensis]|uniref:Transcriptional regulator, TetR family n=1 Tax=Deinococcus hopiensis KR-140 TaxID=695939 RepID=A0A1W1VKE2_9DEIO|nr:TetR/AcrR family transcriptional regulator [Deinococcus hopiensis]SMB93845.1 transcriptional regulator, TetR family [Deinococcus hopiensis KR-140]
MPSSNPPADFPGHRLPVQRRSRERVDRILASTRSLIEQQGSDHLKMREVARHAGIPIGSLYQYFADKGALIATLAQQYNALGRACTSAELAGVQVRADLPPALQRITDGFYKLYLEEPVMHDLWAATQTDKALQALETEDAEAHTHMLVDVLTRLYPEREPNQRQTAALLVMHLLATTVRLAITQDRPRGEALITTFKRSVLGEPLRALSEEP